MTRSEPKSAGWTRWPDVRDRLRRRWDRGVDLAAYVAGEPWSPFAIALKGPSASEIGASFDAARDWVDGWRKVEMNGSRLDWRTVGGRVVGTNRLPARVWIDGYPQLWRATGVEAQVRRLDSVVDLVRRADARLLPVVARRPKRAVDLYEEWPALLATTSWIEANQRPGMYLRQVDVPGVDTKFIERHKGVLAELLDAALAPDRIDESFPRSELATRYGFARKPSYVRLRSLGTPEPCLGSFAEATVRTGDLSATPPASGRVFIIENEISYLAFPDVPNAIAIHGSGYAVSGLSVAAWLNDRQIIYWGDIDTHGFAILARLRRHFAAVLSMLMDRDTLLAHEHQWVREDSPNSAALAELTPAEARLYSDMIEDRYGSNVRLEQERVRYGAVQRAIRDLSVVAHHDDSN